MKFTVSISKQKSNANVNVHDRGFIDEDKLTETELACFTIIDSNEYRVVLRLISINS
jgi:hypothetical protein